MVHGVAWSFGESAEVHEVSKCRSAEVTMLEHPEKLWRGLFHHRGGNINEVPGCKLLRQSISAKLRDSGGGF